MNLSRRFGMGQSRRTGMDQSGGEGAEMRPVRLAAVFVQADTGVGGVRYRTRTGERSAIKIILFNTRMVQIDVRVLRFSGICVIPARYV